jgi:Rab GDP dissociation inhibitor
MDEEYDVIILGTGLKECVLSGVLSKEGKKVLHMDRNDYYGGASASLTPLSKVYEHFGKEGKPADALGKERDYNIDLIPKFLMASGDLVKALVYTGVTRYLDFKSVEGSYVYKNPGKVWKVPSTSSEGLKSSLMGPFQKMKFRSFIMAVHSWEANNPSTHGKYMKPTMTMQQVYSGYGLDGNTADFVGHALALHTDDSYKGRPCGETIEKIILYGDSIARYGSSPYLYPLYGLGELPQGFARLSAIYGGTYMLNRPIEGVEYGEDGKVTGVKAPDPDDNETVKTVKTKMVIADPSYFPDKTRKVGRVARAICILNHPLPKTNGTAPDGGGYSSQIIVPGNQIAQGGISKKNDIYVGAVSQAHNVAAKGHWVAVVSTLMDNEASSPEAELQLGLDLCGERLETFIAAEDLMVPVADGTADSVFISTSYDATTHFQTTFTDIADIYQRAMGKPLDLSQEDAGAATAEPE